MTFPPVITTAWEFARGYHPVAAMASAAVTAALLTSRQSRGWLVAGAAILGGSWVLADGQVVATAVRTAPDSLRVALVAGAVVGAGLGYVVPAWAGVFVGRRVVWGWGWPSAIVISLAVSAAFMRIAGV